MTWAERAAEKIVRRAHGRMAMLKLHGHEIPAWYLFTEYLASYRDLFYIWVLQWFLPREEEE